MKTKISKSFKNCFITGMVILLPLALTFGIIRFLVDFLTKPFLGYIKKLINQYASVEKIQFLTSHEGLVENGAKLVILLVIIAFILLLGLFTRIFFLQQLINLWDHAINKIPLIKAFYKTTKDLLKTLFISDKNAFKHVVMVKFPKDHTYVLGLIVKEAPEACNSASGLELISVFIPTTPNPTSGYVVMVEKKDLHHVDLKPEEALKFILTCGAVSPCKKSS